MQINKKLGNRIDVNEVASAIKVLVINECIKALVIHVVFGVII